MNILLLTDPAIGGTFLTWTLYFLTGETKYIHFHEKTVLDLPTNPVRQTNAHDFGAVHTVYKKNVDKILQPQTFYNENKIKCVYLHSFVDATEIENVSIMKELLDWADKVLIVRLAPSQRLYNIKYIGRTLGTKITNPEERYRDWDEKHDDFIKQYFGKSFKIWETLELNEIWDRREFLALNLRPLEIGSSILSYVPSDCENFTLDSRDLWTCLETSIDHLFRYLDIQVDKQRWNNWLGVYNQWRLIHQDRLRFSWYFDEIISGILTGTDMPLERFNLDIIREATIQHFLIYKHDLNLKTWQLEKFTNTKQLHELLEPNTHNIVKYCGI